VIIAKELKNGQGMIRVKVRQVYDPGQGRPVPAQDAEMAFDRRVIPWSACFSAQIIYLGDTIATIRLHLGGGPLPFVKARAYRFKRGQA